MKKKLTAAGLTILSICSFSITLKAQDPMLGEIRLFAGNFAPRGWAICDGRLLSILENTSLFSILGTNYGGDGRTNFALPDLRGRVPIGIGQGPGLINSTIGQKKGNESFTISPAQLPAHLHMIAGIAEISYGPPANDKPSIKVLVRANTPGSIPVTDLSTANSATKGLITNMSNLQPSLGLNYIIAISGVFPARD